MSELEKVITDFEKIAAIEVEVERLKARIAEFEMRLWAVAEQAEHAFRFSQVHRIVP